MRKAGGVAVLSGVSGMVLFVLLWMLSVQTDSDTPSGISAAVHPWAVKLFFVIFGLTLHIANGINLYLNELIAAMHVGHVNVGAWSLDILLSFIAMVSSGLGVVFAQFAILGYFAALLHEKIRDRVRGGRAGG